MTNFQFSIFNSQFSLLCRPGGMRWPALFLSGFMAGSLVSHAASPSFKLPEGFGIDGLIGLSFLRNFDYAVRSIAGKMCVRPAAPEAMLF